MFVEKSSEEIAKMTEEAKASYIVEKNAHDLSELGKKHDEAMEAKASKEDLEKMATEIKALKDARVDALESALKAQGVEMAKVVKQVDEASKGQSVDFKSALLEGLNDRSEELKGMIKSGASKVVLDIKANQDASDITNGSDWATMEPGVGQIPTRQPFIRELFQNQNTSSEYVKYNDQETIVRDAKNVAGCAASTHTSKITWQVRTMQISKVRDFVDVCIDMMDDYDFVQGEITNLVSTDVRLRVDEQLLLGTGVYPELNSVDSTASTFAAGSYATSVATPVIADLIKVTACQIADAGQNNAYSANWALLNPVDACLMQLEKDANGNYLLPSYITSDGVQVGAVRVIANNLVPSNEMYIGDFTKGTVFSRRGMTVEFGFENNDNFEREIVTVKAYERLNLRVRNVDANAFMHVPSISAALTAITA
jgi:hypothetical protein